MLLNLYTMMKNINWRQKTKSGDSQCDPCGREKWRGSPVQWRVAGIARYRRLASATGRWRRSRARQWTIPRRDTLQSTISCRLESLPGLQLTHLGPWKWSFWAFLPLAGSRILRRRLRSRREAEIGRCREPSPRRKYYQSITDLMKKPLPEEGDEGLSNGDRSGFSAWAHMGSLVPLGSP